MPRKKNYFHDQSYLLNCNSTSEILPKTPKFRSYKIVLKEPGGAEIGKKLKNSKNMNIFEFWHENISFKVNQKYRTLYIS